jgi:hypothetical protein
MTRDERGSILLWFAIAVLTVLLGLAYCRPFTIDVDNAGDPAAQAAFMNAALRCSKCCGHVASIQTCRVLKAALLSSVDSMYRICSIVSVMRSSSIA